MITGNEPAMPMPTRWELNNIDVILPVYNSHSYGLTIRQQLAAMAMQGILSNIDFTDYIPESVAAESVKAADALIAELNKAEV